MCYMLMSKVCLTFSHKLWPKFGNRWISRIGSLRRKALIPALRSREIFTKKCRQQQNFDSDPKEAWHYNHVTFTPIAKNVMLFCRLIYMWSMLYVRLTIKPKVGIPESVKIGWYPHKITGSSHLKGPLFRVGVASKHFWPTVRFAYVIFVRITHFSQPWVACLADSLNLLCRASANYCIISCSNPAESQGHMSAFLTG